MPRLLMLFEPPAGGVARHVAQLALRLRAHGYEVEAAGPEESAAYGELDAAGIGIRRLPLAPGYGRPARDAAALRRLTTLLRERRHDLVHCHSAKAGVLGRLAGRRTRTPVVYSPHSFPFVGDFSALRRRVAVAVERALGRSAAAIVCVCEAERRLALDRRVAPAEALKVVYNGCEPCADAVSPDPGLSELRSGGPVAAAITELREQKSVDVLLEAAPLVLDRLPAARIAIVGDGPQREVLHERAARLGLDREDRFRFMPFTPPADRYLRTADLYVLPSAWEALPIGILEAQACGVPQVVTDVGGSGEAVVPETGLLVPRRDPPALAAAIVELLADGERRAAMGGASRRRHAERFGLDRMVAETAAVYDEVLARGPRERP